MSHHPLLTDTSIPVSVTLAATIGLNEAVLLTVINQVALGQPAQQIVVRRDLLRQLMPFWDDLTIRQTLTALCDKGLLVLSGPMYPEARELHLAFVQEQTAPVPSPSRPAPVFTRQPDSHQPGHLQPTAEAYSGTMNRNAHHHSHVQETSTAGQPPDSRTGTVQVSDWKPSEDTLKRLQQHGIPASFSWAQLDTFLLQSQERGQNRNDWNTRFFRHVKSQWVFTQNDAQRQKNRYESATFQVTQDEPKPINGQWRPSSDAMQILQRSGVDPQFIEDAIPEFVLYWSERGEAHKTWNSKFIQHIRQQWARYSASLEHSNLPLPISSDWQPAADCFDILAMAHIDPEFARSRVAEFVLYWRDSGQVHNSWNSRFLQYIKQQWASQLARPETQNDGQRSAEPDYSTAAASLQRLNDTDW
ncbi:MAG: hypothetical protein CMI09_14960 [Oceanospirillaceae bacterium]|nr:hypothetical protein [Oceanospirillaceae bacterium]|tara:strand:+ start:332 stop:1579 length:1248 start_codon:yes stop_codon:yes gene_type:complete